MENRQKVFERIFREHLKIETYSKSIDSLFAPRLKNRIDYKPYYQRNYVWDNNKATYFIESILIGTEVPPLIFFNNNDEIEIIDGRQRFETILRFMDNKFQLSTKGLNVLKQLKKYSYDDLAKLNKDIIDIFLDAKIRIIEFKLVNEPPLDKHLEDRIKKEIFSRYNTGITPLKKSELDNAIYDEDNLSNDFKKILQNNLSLRKRIFNTFFKPTKNKIDDPPVEDIMSFIRRFLILPMYPIKSYASGGGRTEILFLLYNYYSNQSEDTNEVVNRFLDKTKFLYEVKKYSLEKNLKINRLAIETFLWVFGVLDLENIKYEMNDALLKSIANHIDNSFMSYTEVDYQFSREVIERYNSTASFISGYFDTNLNMYITANEKKRSEIKELRNPVDTSTKLSELENLRLNKPEPSRNSIDDIIRTMNRRKFLIRPSYQRKEVINPTKASSIIESILLDIKIPPIFIYKRKNGINEVIDGQQRILTILGYLGEKYLNQNDQTEYSKNHKFSLRGLRILKELDRNKFDQLDVKLQNKILDFQLYIIEIDEQQNPFFDPIDLFIRLNDKPYPIRVNSFEMWNSWVDNEVIDRIKLTSNEIKKWFYLKHFSRRNDRDRMENEELIASLIYLEYSKVKPISKKPLDIYQKTERINARIGNKASITTLFQHVNENEEVKKELFKSIKNVKSFIKKLKYVILDKDKNKDELFSYLRDELDLIFKANKTSRIFRRTMQDFYILWFILSDLNLEMVKFHRLVMKNEIKDIFIYMKNIPEDKWENNEGYDEFLKLLHNFKRKYQQDSRKISLTEKEKLNFIREQKGKSGISDAPIFLGDDIEVDHKHSLATGGKDKVDNLQIVHKDENRKKSFK